MKKFLRSRFFKVMACIGFVSLITAYGIIEPDGLSGKVVFHTAYAYPSTRPAVLRYYSWSLKEYNGGSIPSTFDDYLINRLAHCEGSDEETAIIDFQIRQGSARWGVAASGSHESKQHQMISNIFKRLDTMEDEDVASALLFVESLRRQDSLSKGGIRGMWIQSGNTTTLNQDAFKECKERYCAWWGDGSGWPGIRSIDPLSGSRFVIETGPQ